MGKSLLGSVVCALIFLFECSAQNSNSNLSVADALPNQQVEIVDAIFIDSVWVANKVSFDLYTIGDKQFVAYYDKSRMMTVASRKLGSDNWQRKTLSSKLHWDSHNYVTMGFDEEGHNHISGNMHVNPLVYFRSEKPYDIQSIIEVPTMIGENEDKITYPKFFNTQNGELLYMYRTGGSGRGDTWVNRFDTTSKKWKPYLTNGLFKGIAGNESRSAYNKFVKGPDGNFHYIWMWRWLPAVETCHQLCYATSKDFLNWKNAQGESVSLPFTPDNEKLIVDDVPSKGGLHNSKYDITFLKDGTPIIGYLKYDEEGLTQLYLSRFKNGKWFSKKISNWDFRWKFIGGGDKMTKGASFDFVEVDDSESLVVEWSTEKGEAGNYVVDGATFELSNEKIFIKPEYPASIRDRITQDPELSVNLQKGKNKDKADDTKYVLKWESMGKSHGRHAPEVIPKGPLSPLYLIEIQRNDSEVKEVRSPKIESSLTSLDFDKLQTVKQHIEKGDSTYLPAYKNLIRTADKALDEGPFSVVNKTQVPVSGDKHDYLSLGPYWWPDPDKPDGLPWMCRDGEINPLTRGENVDEPRKRKMFNNVFKLGLAFFFSEDRKYAEKAIELLKVWFLNPETKMNPNLDYAQGIPGRNNGRGIGIIEFLGINNITTTIELLELQYALDAQTGSALRKWLADYLLWLQTSENGISEKNWKNNHGTWYDVQEVGILLFLDRPKEAKAVLESVKQKRIAKQIEVDGKQPHELARTKTLSYSTMNLKGFTHLAYYGKRTGVDLWNYNPPNAGGIQDAYGFLWPYALEEKRWKRQQLGKLESQVVRLQNLFVMAGSMFDQENYCKLRTNLSDSTDISELLYPCLD